MTASRSEPHLTDELRFVVDLADQSVSDEWINSRVGAVIGVAAETSALFEPDPDLDRFRLIRLQRDDEMDRADRFDYAASMRSALNARSVEPDLATDFFAMSAMEVPPEEAVESAVTWWCWADPEADRPEADWALRVSKVREAWEYSKDANKPDAGRDVVVFQPDTGVVAAHRQLPPDILIDPRAVSFIEPGFPASDPLDGGMNPGHGTGTGSVVASPITPKLQGVAPRSTLVPLRCTRSVAVIDQSLIAQAIDYSRRNGAHVISLSLGGAPSAALHAAVAKAVRENAVLVAAAGNCVGAVVWPARYPESIAVGGINESLRPWRGSSRGRSVAFSAPAELVARAAVDNVADPLDGVGLGQGTSFAAAITAGVAALWIAHHGRDELIQMLPPDKTLQEMFRILVGVTAQVPQGFDRDQYGAGILDARRLLEYDPALTPWDTNSRAQREANDRDDLQHFVNRAFAGPDGLEASSRFLEALEDPQLELEVLYVALERERATRSLLAHVEAMPPANMSATLRRYLAGAPVR